MGREGAGQEGISPGSPSWGGAFNCVLPLGSALPPPRPRARPVFAMGIWAGRAGFHSLVAFACFLRRGQAPALPSSPGADGSQWESAQRVLRGLAPFFPPFVLLPTVARAQTTKAACLAASRGAAGVAEVPLEKSHPRVSRRAGSTQAPGRAGILSDRLHPWGSLGRCLRQSVRGPGPDSDGQPGFASRNPIAWQNSL